MDTGHPLRPSKWISLENVPLLQKPQGPKFFVAFTEQERNLHKLRKDTELQLLLQNRKAAQLWTPLGGHAPTQLCTLH